MNASWLSYIPQHVISDILSHPSEIPIGRRYWLDVVALFAYVSGFTPISEALAVADPEALDQILNSYFEPMIDLAQSYGGIVGKFAGNGMMIIFPHDAASRGAVIRGAIQCALDMQTAMARYEAIQTPEGTFSVVMKAGLAIGPVFCTTVGDPAL